MLFPNTILIVHPDYVSHVSLLPLAPDRLTWVHAMLIPMAPTTDEDRAHWDGLLELIEETVFQQEDLVVAEHMQAGITSGANESLTLGKLESAIARFHDEIDRTIAAASEQ